MTDPHTGAAKRWLLTASLPCHSGRIALSDRQLLDSLGQMPFVDSTELVGLFTEGIAGRVSHGTVHSSSSHRYFLTAQGTREVAQVLSFPTPSEFVRAYPNVQGVAGAAQQEDGRRGRRLPNGCVNVHHRLR